MGNIVQLSCRMRAVTKMALDPQGYALAIRLAKAPKDLPGIPPNAEWVWAVVQEDPAGNEPARVLVGGSATSWSEAIARAQEKFSEYENRKGPKNG